MAGDTPQEPISVDDTPQASRDDETRPDAADDASASGAPCSSRASMETTQSQDDAERQVIGATLNTLHVNYAQAAASCSEEGGLSSAQADQLLSSLEALIQRRQASD